MKGRQKHLLCDCIPGDLRRCRLSADLLWGIADIMMGGMTIINMPVIFYLGKYAIRALKDYEGQLKKGGEITFNKNNIDLPHETDY